MKKLLTSLIITFCLTSLSLASPAVELFNQAANFIETQYFGPTTVVIPDVLAQYRTELALTCLRTAQPRDCSFERAEPVIARLFAAIQDGHAYYLSAEAVRQENANRSGQAITPRPAVGLRFSVFCDTPNGTCAYNDQGELQSAVLRDQLVARVSFGSPAESAGVRYGDRLIGYNNTLFSSFETFADYQKFRADLTPKIQASESVTLNLLRGENRERIDIALTGAIFNTSQMPKLELRPDGIAVLTVRDYQIRGVGQRIHELVRQAEQSGAKGIIFEERQNGGGSVYEMMLAVGAFVPQPDSFRFVPRYNPESGTIEFGYTTGVATIKIGAGAILPGSSISNPIASRLPIAVLVDGNCASGCEYFATYIQRHKRGVVIGSKTAGVGNSNTARFPLANGGSAGIPTLRAFWLDGTGLPAFVEADLKLPTLEWDLFSTGRDQAVLLALNALKTPTSIAQQSARLPSALQPLVWQAKSYQPTSDL
jgi:carboxyl-terminal processing protease